MLFVLRCVLFVVCLMYIGYSLFVACSVLGVVCCCLLLFVVRFSLFGIRRSWFVGFVLR